MNLKLKYTPADIDLYGMEGKSASLYEGKEGSVVLTIMETENKTAAVVVIESPKITFSLENKGTKIVLDGFVRSNLGTAADYTQVHLELV